MSCVVRVRGNHWFCRFLFIRFLVVSFSKCTCALRGYGYKTSLNHIVYISTVHNTNLLSFMFFTSGSSTIQPVSVEVSLSSYVCPASVYIGMSRNRSPLICTLVFIKPTYLITCKGETPFQMMKATRA